MNPETEKLLRETTTALIKIPGFAKQAPLVYNSLVDMLMSSAASLDKLTKPVLQTFNRSRWPLLDIKRFGHMIFDYMICVSNIPSHPDEAHDRLLWWRRYYKNEINALNNEP